MKISFSPVTTPLVARLSGKCRTPLRSVTGIAVVAGAFILASPFSQAASSSAGALTFAKSRFLVEPRAGLSPTALAKILSPHGGRARKIGQSNLYIVDLPATASEQAVVEKLAHHPLLKFAELDRRVKSTFVPNDPYYGSEWHLNRVGAPTAWDSTLGIGVTIAILDSGVDGAHPDLLPNLVAGYNFVENNTNTSDVCGHGTAVAGTAAASTNNGTGVAGIAGQAKIMPLRIAYFDTAYNGCYAYYSTIASGITYAADQGARIANASYGGLAGSSSIQSAGQYLKNKGGLLFVSAGNYGVNGNAPATTTMIPVSATDGNDVITSWSSYGDYVALSAPGLGIYTTSQGGAYDSWSGTSFSSPLAAGVGALLMAANPSLDNLTVENLLYSTAVDLGATGRDIYYGYGRVNAAAGVQAALARTVTVDTQPPAASLSAPLAGSTVSGLVAVDVSATDNVGVTSVALLVNGTTVAVGSASPFGFSWDSTGVPNGTATLVAVAADAAGNKTSSASVAVNVSNYIAPPTTDTTPPVVSITNPVAGRVSGNISVTVSASDNSGAAGISQWIYIDGTLKASGTGGSLAYNWNTHRVAYGTHTIDAVARDAAGNTSSTSVQVTK